MSIIYDLRLPNKPENKAPVYVVVYAGGMAYGQGRDEQFLGLSRLSESLTNELNEFFGGVHPCGGDNPCLTAVWGHPIFRLDSEAWRDRMVPERIHSAWGPKANMGDSVLEITKTGPEHPDVGGNWTAGWVKPNREHYPRLGRRAIKWCLDGITQRYFALGPMSCADAEHLQRDKGPVGVAIVSRAGLEAAFSHSDNWGGVHTDG